MASSLQGGAEESQSVLVLFSSLEHLSAVLFNLLISFESQKWSWFILGFHQCYSETLKMLLQLRATLAAGHVLDRSVLSGSRGSGIYNPSMLKQEVTRLRTKTK